MPEKTTLNLSVQEDAHKTKPLARDPAGPTMPLGATVRFVQRSLQSPAGFASRHLTGRVQPKDVLHLQRAAGNRAVTGLIAQAKLTVGPANDTYEQEADRVAQQVLNQPASTQSGVQRQASPDEDEVQTKPLSASISRVQRAASLLREAAPEEEEEVQTKRLQREAAPEEEEEVQTSRLQRAGDSSFATSDTFEERLNGARSGGDKLPNELRADFEPRFGADFSGVRVHTGAEAGTLNREVQAKAFTLGSDIFFGEGQYDPHTQPGKELLAHELTHTIQQGATPVKTAQREAAPEEEEEVQTRRLQREAAPEEEEELQGKRLQREAAPEEEEEVQAKRLQR